MKSFKIMAEELLKFPKKLLHSRLLVKSNERTRIEAVLDLVCLMSDQDKISSIILNGHKFKIYKNQVATTSRILANRWNWKQSRVIDLLAFLECEGYIKFIEVTSKGSVFELCF